MMPRPVQARFEYTVADFREYQRDFRRRNIWLLWPLFLVMALLVLLVWFLGRSTPLPPVAPPVMRPATPASLLEVFLPLVPWFLISGAVLVTLRIVRSRQGPRALARAPAYQGEIVADVDVTGVSMQSPLYRAQYHWEAVVRFRETRRLFLLFVSPNMAMVLPKRGFANPSDLDAMRAMARKLSGHPGPGFPVVPATPPPLPEGAA